MAEGDESVASAGPGSSRGGGSGRRRRRWVVRTALGVIAAIALYLVVTFVQVWRAESWTSGARADAIVVLGAAQYNGRPSPAYRGRLDHAAALFKARQAPEVVVTGSRKPGDRFTEAIAGFDYLRRHGVPEASLVVVDTGTSTWESLAAAARVLRKQGSTKVVLVSDPYHSFRSTGIAEEVGLSAEVSPTGARSTFGELVREAGLVSVGRIIGYRRVVAWFE